ncbi:TolC family protein [Sagittula sp. SSi028]|uniref:TolC family protein n=1 Tax=Sagittula sp. SSi028 TaxID=3400636 RepID=UPI003AF88A19
MRRLGVLLPLGLLIAGCETIPVPVGAPAPRPAVAEPVVATSTPRPVPKTAGSLAGTAFGASVRNAVLAHPRLGQAAAQVGSALADLEAAKGAFRPALSTGIDFRSEVSGRDGDRRDAVDPYVRVSQLIYDGGVSRHQKAAATADVARAEDDRIATAASVAMAAVEAQVNLASAYQELALRRENLTTHKSFLSQMQERRDVGAGSESDYMTARSRFADAQTALVDAEAEVERNRALYAEAFGIAASGSTVFPPQAPDLLTNQSQALSQSPRLRTLDAQIAASQARLAVARAGRIPRIEAGGTALPGDDGGADVVFDLSVEYQFDTRRQSAAGIQRAEADVNGLMAEKDLLLRDITRALEFLASDRIAGQKRLSVAQTAVSANRLNVAAARDEFLIGRSTLLDVLDKQRDYINAQQRVIAARADQILVGYQALALTGDIVPVFGIATGEGDRL